MAPDQEGPPARRDVHIVHYSDSSAGPKDDRVPVGKKCVINGKWGERSAALIRCLESFWSSQEVHPPKLCRLSPPNSPLDLVALGWNEGRRMGMSRVIVGRSRLHSSASILPPQHGPVYHSSCCALPPPLCSPSSPPQVSPLIPTVRSPSLGPNGFPVCAASHLGSSWSHPLPLFPRHSLPTCGGRWSVDRPVGSREDAGCHVDLMDWCSCPSVRGFAADLSVLCFTGSARRCNPATCAIFNRAKAPFSYVRPSPSPLLSPSSSLPRLGHRPPLPSSSFLLRGYRAVHPVGLLREEDCGV